jgi:DNA modification methylase
VKLIWGDSLQKLKDLPTNTIDAVVTDPPYGLAFMGKKWDYDVPSEDLWREVFRVMKPGAHLLSFFGTRTYHAGVTRIEAAGFEVRDMLSWLYGSGFPKSLDVSKAIDKAAGAEREVIGKGNSGPNIRGNKYAQVHGQEREQFVVTAPATPAAQKWQGWGTALKPANEPIVLARKPLEKGLTVAENVLKWGTGALAIDASRIAAKDQHVLDAAVKRMTGNTPKGWKQTSAVAKPVSAEGRWPANVLFDEQAAAALDEQSGPCKTGGKNIKTDCGDSMFGKRNVRGVMNTDNGSGASRFFYVAKASKRERNAGLAGLPEKDPPGSKRSKPAEGRQSALGAPRANHHPTVKPLALMQYLIRLVTPPGGIVLDPFMGSGTTGCAAVKLGFQFIGIEREEEYLEIARRRIEFWQGDAPADQADEDQMKLPLEPA